MTPEELQAGLDQFHGTETWYRYSPMFRYLLLTEGVKFLAENAGAYWLMDAIGSHIATNPRLTHTRNPAQFWTLAVNNSKATLRCTDGGKHGAQAIELAKQEIEYTDFPLASIDIWVMWDEIVDPRGAFVAMLPGEY